MSELSTTMGKGKKKSKGKKRGGKNTRCTVEDEVVSGITRVQKERAIEAALNRKEDPLENWERPQQDECPLCMITLPPHESECLYLTCCGKTVCWGCAFYGMVGVHVRNGRDLSEAMELGEICPFCRESHVRAYKSVMNRAEDRQHEAMFQVGMYGLKGKNSHTVNEAEGMKWLQVAVEAGSGKAAFQLGRWYFGGEFVDHDIEKALGYFRKGAELGYTPSFHIMGLILLEDGEIEEGMLNFRKAAIGGVSNSGLFIALRYGFSKGYITKEEYALTLRKNQAICDELNSEGRQKFRLFLEASKRARPGK